MAMSKIREAVQEAREGAAQWARDELANRILVGPHDGGRSGGPGFTVLIGDAQIGWWPTRREACGVAESLAIVIKSYPLGKVPPPW